MAVFTILKLLLIDDMIRIDTYAILTMLTRLVLDCKHPRDTMKRAYMLNDSTKNLAELSIFFIIL